MWASVLGRTLKKDVGDLKNYIKELGLIMEVSKNPKSNLSDIMIYLNAPVSKSQKKKEEEEKTEE